MSPNVIMNNTRDKVKRYFRGIEKYNCAQAILKVFQDECNISDDKIKEYVKYGHGRVPDGVCGALYVINELINDDKREEQKRRRREDIIEFIGFIGEKRDCINLPSIQNLLLLSVMQW